MAQRGTDEEGVRTRAPSQTLDRGLQLLDILSRSDEPMSLSALALAMGLHRSIVYRLLRTLMPRHFVAHTTFGYVLGTGAHSLGRRTSPDLQRIAKPEIATLAGTIGLTAFFVVRDGEEAVTLVSVEVVSARTNVAYTPGDRHPLTLGSPGLAILSAEPPRPGERAEIAHARTVGYAHTRSEVLPGMATMSAPVLAVDDRAVAAVAVAFRHERIGMAEVKALTDSACRLTAQVRRAQTQGAVLPGLD